MTFKGYEVIETETDRQKTMGAGFDGYHGKPINVTDFVMEVARLLERRRT